MSQVIAGWEKKTHGSGELQWGENNAHMVRDHNKLRLDLVTGKLYATAPNAPFISLLLLPAAQAHTKLGIGKHTFKIVTY